MIHSTTYSNSLNLFWLLLLGVTFPYIAFSHRLLAPLIVYYILLLYIAICYSNAYMYRIEIHKDVIYKIFLLKKDKEEIYFESISLIEIIIPSVRSSPAIKIYYIKNKAVKRIWFPCLNTEDLKKFFIFFKEKDIKIKILPESKGYIFN